CIVTIIYGAPSWNDLCKTLNALLYRLRYCNISVSLPKSEFGVKKCKYLGHDISSDGIWASPKPAEKDLNLPLPKTQKGVQSFLGSLNYYAKFIEDLPVLAATLYETSDEQLRSGRDLEKPRHVFRILKDRLVSTPLLQHPDPGRQYKILVYTRYSVLAWLFKSKTVDGRCLKWVVNLSPWDLDIRRGENDEDGFAAILGADITPPPGTLRRSRRDPSFGKGFPDQDTTRGAACILWSLPSWETVAATGHFLEKATVNEAEYSGLVKGMQLALDAGETEGLQAKFKSLLLVHVKRDFHADYISKRVIQEQASLEVTDLRKRKLLQGLNRIHEKLMKDPRPTEQSLVECAFIATARGIPRCSPGGETFVTTRSASEQSKVAEESTREFGADHLEFVDPEADELGTEGAEDELTAGPRNSDSQGSEDNPEDAQQLSLRQTTHLTKIADQFVLDSRDALFYVSRNIPERPRHAADRLCLVVPQDLQGNILHHCHADLQGAHQGIIRTCERLRKEFYWIGMFKDTERYVKECVDCVTAKGLPQNPGSSPGNLLATRPFQVVSMDFVIPLHQSARGNTALLLFQCAISGFIMCKAMVSTEAQDVAEAYEECVFRRFVASEMIRHDRDPRFMGRVFKHFREMLGSRQRATLAYRPQANGQQARSVHTVIRDVKAYVQTVEQSDWDELAEKLMWALSTSFDFTRLDTPFYLVYGWATQGTVEALMGNFPRDVQLRDVQEWRTKIQRQVEYARAWARDLQAKTKRRRAEDHNRKWKLLTDRLKEGFEVGDSVWVYLARVRPGLTKKLAHLWHGPFRILEKGSDYRPSEAMNIPEDDDFDAALLREDSWEPDEGSGEYEVEAILDVRWVTRTRTSRRVKEYQVKWKGYEGSVWVPQGHLNCGRLLYEFDQGERARVRF
ncbi:reverse transcriptase, partial [Phytophthora megakarya]